jgi:hypothetical protein
MMTERLILKRASASRSSGQWRDDDYDVLEDHVMASGHVNRTKRPNTWLHRPACKT